MPLKINKGDLIKTKKKHPCGSDLWHVLRTGADFVIKCDKCGHQTWISRPKLEKAIKELIPKNKEK